MRGEGGCTHTSVIVEGAGLTMSVKRVHARKVLLATLARVRANVEVELLVALAVVLPREALAAPRPLALIRLLFRVRAQMACACPPGGSCTTSIVKDGKSRPVSSDTAHKRLDEANDQLTLQVKVPRKGAPAPWNRTSEVGWLLPAVVAVLGVVTCGLVTVIGIAPSVPGIST